MFLEIPYPRISPTLIEFGPLQVRWYALMYIVGFQVGMWLVRRRARRGLFTLPEDHADALAFYLFVGMLIGARLFYATVYQPEIWSRGPFEIFAVWRGGLSFHGAVLGMAVACIAFARRRDVPFLMVADTFAIVAPPGLFFGRIGNFINAELYGRATDVPWAMRFPTDPQRLLRHPSQLYEALFEGLLLGMALWALQRTALARGSYRFGLIAGAFLLLYGIGRFAIEYTREPDAQLGLVLGPFSMGQVLCLAMMAAGIIWLSVIRRRAPFTPAG
jgi:phosphatidylglycerol:prolipoprotein diacylglycerol transferase